MATNDLKNPQAASNPGSGRRESAPGPNDSSDTFTDMPSASPNQGSTGDNAGKRSDEDRKVDISSADDVDVDKDIPVDDESTTDSPPDAE